MTTTRINAVKLNAYNGDQFELEIIRQSKGTKGFKEMSVVHTDVRPNTYRRFMKILLENKNYSFVSPGVVIHKSKKRTYYRSFDMGASIWE